MEPWSSGKSGYLRREKTQVQSQLFPNVFISLGGREKIENLPIYNSA